MFYKLDKFDEAIKSFDKAIALDPNFEEAWFYKGGAFHYSGEYRKAIAAYDRAIVIDPNDQLAWFAKGLAFYRLNDYDKAVEAYDEATSLDPSFEEAWSNKGNAYYYLGEYKKSIEAFDRAIAIDPNDKIAWLGKGYTLDTLGEFGRAIEAYDRAISIDPNLEDAKKYRRLAVKKMAEQTITSPIEDKKWMLVGGIGIFILIGIIAYRYRLYVFGSFFRRMKLPKLIGQDYRIVAGFSSFYIMLILLMAIPGPSDTIYTSQRCDGELYDGTIEYGPIYIDGQGMCDGTWVYEDPMPVPPEDILNYYLDVHRWVMAAGLIAGFACYLGYRTRVLGWYYGLLGQVFNPAIGIPFTRPEWVLMYEIALVSFVILLGFLLFVTPKPSSDSRVETGRRCEVEGCNEPGSIYIVGWRENGGICLCPMHAPNNNGMLSQGFLEYDESAPVRAEAPQR